MTIKIIDIITNISKELDVLGKKRADILHTLKEIEFTADDELMSDSDFREWVRKKTRLSYKTL